MYILELLIFLAGEYVLVIFSIVSMAVRPSVIGIEGYMLLISAVYR